MEEKNKVTEVSTEEVTTDDYSVDVTNESDIDIVPESNGIGGKMVAGLVAGVAAITAGAVFLYKKNKKKKAKKETEKTDDWDDFDDFDDDILEEESKEDQEANEEPKKSEKDSEKK